MNRVSDIETYQHFTGFGLYDRKVMDLVSEFKDPYPYFRGMIAEIGLPHAEIPYRQPRRKRGITKNNFYTLYDLAMLGITNLSKVPLGWSHYRASSAPCSASSCLLFTAFTSCCSGTIFT